MDQAPILEKVKVKTFTGIRLTVDLKHLLSQSVEWKQETLTQTTNAESLKIIHYQDKDYIGYYLDQEVNSLSKIKKAEKNIKEKLQQLCPEFSLDNCKCIVFPQLLVS